MKDATLIVLAAGMGSRYGGLKQIDSIGPNGEVILELSVYDAIQAGFNKVVFIINEKIKEDFMNAVGKRIEKIVKVEYVYQELDQLPEGIQMPEGRVKPWGTVHALLCCKDIVKEPFAVINADDYYGQQCFHKMYDFLVQQERANAYCMIGYTVENTITEHGTVTRGLCSMKDGFLTSIKECKGLARRDGKVQYVEDEQFYDVDLDTLVSMNMWGFTPLVFEQMEAMFVAILKDLVEKDPLKGEFYIPLAVDELIKDKAATIRMIPCTDRWYGVTYQEDKPMVKEGLQKLFAQGLYPEHLW